MLLKAKRAKTLLLPAVAFRDGMNYTSLALFVIYEQNKTGTNNNNNKTYNLVTFMVSIQLNSHWDVSMPSYRVKADEACPDRRFKVMVNNRVPISVSIKFLKSKNIA